jgi:hypothetical protein
VSDPLSSFPVGIHRPFFLSPLVSFFSYHVTSKSLNNIHSYNAIYLPKFIQKKIPWSTPISQKLCPTVTPSHQDGGHSAVALLLKAALIQVSDYRLLCEPLVLQVLLYTVLFVKLG